VSPHAPLLQLVTPVNNEQFYTEDDDVSDIALPCPPDIDPEFFESLPLDIQMELVRGMRA
jgi:hypothetical protein